MSLGQPDVVIVDGDPRQDALLLDRGLHFGDGLFETISCVAGKARFLDLHFERLSEGCQRLRIALTEIDRLREQIVALAAATDACIIKLIITRGEAARRGYGFSGNEQPTSVLLRYTGASEPAPKVLRVGISSIRLGENPALAGLKHLNRLEQVLAHRERDDRGLDELLMLASSGQLISGVMSNVFVVEEGRLSTPDLTRCGVAGIMRRVVMQLASKEGLQCEERVLEAGALDKAREVFLTSSRLGVVAVGQIDGRPLVPGPLTQHMQMLVTALLETPEGE